MFFSLKKKFNVFFYFHLNQMHKLQTCTWLWYIQGRIPFFSP